MKINWIYLPLLILFNYTCRNKNEYPVVTTLAGSGLMGTNDGRGADASFANLMDLTVDTEGNVYVADSHNNLIRRISKDGLVTTIAGSGAVGSSDGKGRAASFFNPAGIAIDKNGILYVADTHNSLIRKITQDGEVTTIAGRRSGLLTSRDSVVQFDNPAGIAVDINGNIFVADWLNDVIRKITPNGHVTNVAGLIGSPGSRNGSRDSATFYLPGGIAVDSAGNVFVSDTYNNMIRKIDNAGIVTTIAGKKLKGALDGQGGTASFSHPAGIALDKLGNLYVADVGNHKIRKVSSSGFVTTFAGNGIRGSKNGRDTAASFYRPYGVSVAPDGTVYVADYQNNMVRKISY